MTGEAGGMDQTRTCTSTRAIIGLVSILCVVGIAVGVYVAVKDDSSSDSSKCKFDTDSNAKADNVCVSIAPIGPDQKKATGAFVADGSTTPVFSCKDGFNATCDTSVNCRPSQLYIRGAFLLGEDHPGDVDGAAPHVRAIQNGVEQEYDLDYLAKGHPVSECAEAADYNNSTCGYRLVGLDVYTLVSEWSSSSDTLQIDGVDGTWAYIRQDDISFADDLQTSIRAGTGQYVYGYTFDLPKDPLPSGLQSGCQVTYKLRFDIPDP